MAAAVGVQPRRDRAARTGRAVTTAQRVSDTDDDALDAFCREQHARLVGMIGLYVGDRALGEELAQEALIRLCRNWSKLPTEADATRWLTRVAMNLAKSSLRTGLGRRRILERYGPTLTRESTPPQASGEGVADALAVRAAVHALPDRQRQVVILRYFDDLPVAEVAAVMGCPEGTVKSLTSAAITSLRNAGLGFDDV